MPAEVHNTVNQPVSGDVLQVGHVTGGLHVHKPGFRPVLPRQLPAAPTTFTGRSSELATLSEGLAGRTVVISALRGAGGMGKTWLALYWAHQHLDQFPDGQLFVNLRGFDPSEKPLDPQEALRGFLAALGVPGPDVPPEPAAQVGLYRSLVADRRLLVVLDNARDSEQVRDLLPGNSQCTVLITSRDQLMGLQVANDTVRSINVTALSEPEAQALLEQRLGRERLAAEPAATAELLRWCAGLPLALSILAGRAMADPETTLAEFAQELRDTASRLAALDGGEPAASLETVLSWSLQELTPEQVRVFGLLGLVPAADIGLHAAASLVGIPVPEVRGILTVLTRVSLVQKKSGRYELHDLVRLFAAAQVPSTEADLALERLVQFYCHTAHAADRLLSPHHEPITLRTPPAGCAPQPLVDKDEAQAWFDAERPTMLPTQQVAVERSWQTSVYQLAWTFTTVNLSQGHFHDNLAAWRAGAQAADQLGDLAKRIRAYRHLGRACTSVDLSLEASRHLEQSLACATLAEDLLGQAHTHRAVASALEQLDDDSAALDHSQRALALYEAAENPRSASHALNEIGWFQAKLGDLAAASKSCTEALEQCRQLDNSRGEAKCLISLGYIAYRAGDPDAAVTSYQQALQLCQNRDDATEADALSHLGTALAESDPDQARTCWRRALEMFRAQGRAGEARRVEQQLTALR